MVLAVVKRQLKACILISLIMAVILPIVSVEIYVLVNDIEDRLDHVAYERAIERGEDPLDAATGSLRKISGFERITHRFQDWYSFQEYLWQVGYYFAVLLIATLLVSGVKLYGNRTT